MFKLFSKSNSRRRSYSYPSASVRRSASPSTGTDKEWTWVKIDKKLAFISFVLICAGLVFTYSSSAFDSVSYFQRQLFFDIIGIGIALFLSQTYTQLQRFFKPIWLVYITWILLIVVLFTKPIANVHRWIPIGPFNLQPSEIAKVTLVIYLADYLSNVQGRLARNFKLLFPPLIVSGITFLLISRAPDLGTVILMGLVMLMMLWAAGANWKHLLVLVPFAVAYVLYQLIFYPYRLMRVIAFFRPDQSTDDAKYQVIRSAMAVGSGGWFGKGLGNSELKLQYLPAAHTDFIFSIMCEEIGLIRILIILAFFCWILIRGISLACASKNTFNSLLIFGLTLTIAGQAFFNMGMAIGIVPPKGIPLPFFSYGGSSVIMTLVMVGIIANAAAQSAVSRKGNSDDFVNYKTRTK